MTSSGDAVVDPQDPDPAIPFAASAFERGVTVSEVTSRLGLLSKTFARRFHERVGLTPKRFSRGRCLQRVVRSIHDPGAADGSEFAAEHGPPRMATLG